MTDTQQRSDAPPGPSMDPRIRQRRIEVTRDQGRHRLRLVAGVLAVAAAIALAVGATRSPLFDVDYVDVRGMVRTERRQVVAAGRLGDHPALVDVDTAAVARRVEALPWVLRAEARRDWPGTVRVVLTERRPVASVPAGEGRWALVDASGRVLEVGTDMPAGLPVIGNVAVPGRPGTSVEPAAGPSLRVAAALPSAIRPRVADVAVHAGGEVELQLVPPGGIVRLGRTDDLRRKLEALATVLERADLSRLAVVDVQVPAAPVLTRR